MTREKRKVAVRMRYLRGISHEVDPVLNIDEFALDGTSSGTKNKHYDDVDMRRRIFDRVEDVLGLQN